jgi:thiosulfate/3-mercaptopyruvate sulfurtransferase
MLISCSTLRDHLQDRAWVVFDCRHDLFDPGYGSRVYGEGHVPGAFLVPIETALAGPKNGRNGRHPLPAPEAFARFLAQHGVSEDTQIVAYDDAGGQYASRLWWLARWIGLHRVAVLDGGWNKWKESEALISKDVPVARQPGHVVARPNRTVWRSVEEVAAGSSKGECLVLDARAAERYRGETEPIDPVGGHIPGARNRFFKTNLNADLTLRPAAEIRREFESLLSGRAPAEVVHQCGSGITACANLLAMEYAGLTGSRLYPGSWSEWVSDSARPVARGAE